MMNPALDVIDLWLSYQLAQGDLPGFQVSIRDNGKLIFSKAYGYSQLNPKIKYSTKIYGRIASQSKVFTAALALSLEEQKRLQLNDLVTKWVPELKAHPDSRFKTVRLTDLLCHRSGMARDSFEIDYWRERKPFLSQRKLISDLLKQNLVYAPRRCTKYSNTDYALAGLIIERATGKSFTSVCHSFLKRLKPKGMPKSDYGSKDRLAQGYIRKQMHGQQFNPEPHRPTYALAPAAGFSATTEIMSEFFHKLYVEQRALAKRQISKLLRNKWPVKNSKSEFYGLGTMFSVVNGQTYIGHSGGFPGFTSQTWVLPKQKLTISFMTNVSAVRTFHFVRTIAEITTAVAQTFKSREFASLKVSPAMADNFTSTVYVIGKNNAFSMSLGSTLPAETIMEFKRRGKLFYSDKLNGYDNVGEPLRFEYRSGKITSVTLGGSKSKPVR